MKIGIFNDDEVEKLRQLLNDPASEQLALVNIRNQVQSDDEYVDVMIELNEFDVTEQEYEDLAVDLLGIKRTIIGLNTEIYIDFDEDTETCQLKIKWCVTLSEFIADSFEEFQTNLKSNYRDALKLCRDTFIKKLNNLNN